MKRRTAKQSRKARVYTAPANLAVPARPSGVPPEADVGAGQQAKKKYSPGCDYKYAAQAKMYRKCKGDLKVFSRLCDEAVARIEREQGFKFRRGVPAGWTPPKVCWLGRVVPGADDPVIAAVRATRRKISAEHGHSTQRLGEHYIKLQEKMKKTGKTQFVSGSLAAKPAKARG